jgi:TfoX/Sxy family transcriptional regulator of competence genes
VATQQSTVDFIIEQVGGAGQVSARKMFGEYGLYCDGKMVALVCDDLLFVKPTHAGRAHIGEIVEGAPYPGAKPCFLISGELWDDGDWLTKLIRISAAELPARATKKRSK